MAKPAYFYRNTNFKTLLMEIKKVVSLHAQLDLMKYNKNGISALFLSSYFLLTLSSCSFKNREALLKTPFDSDTVSTVFVANPSDQPKDYYNLIKPEDELAISNLQNMELIVKANVTTTTGTSTYTTFRVNANGEVNLPKLGFFKVGGLTRVEAAAAIQKAYEVKELNTPLIDVRIANAFVSVLGEATRQGKYIIEREDYELIDLLADAGGLTPNANKRQLRIFRGDRANPEIILVNLEDYSFLKSAKLKLRAKDVIYIEPKRSATSTQNLQTYGALIQIVLVLVNTAVIIYSVTR